VPPDPAARGAAEADDSRARAGLDEVVSRASGTDRADAVAALLWLDFCRLEHACALGRRGAAEEALRRAWALSPGDVMLEERAARCHLEAPAVPR
jgi:hypothetical protein